MTTKKVMIRWDTKCAWNGQEQPVVRNTIDPPSPESLAVGQKVRVKFSSRCCEGKPGGIGQTPKSSHARARTRTPVLKRIYKKVTKKRKESQEELGKPPKAARPEPEPPVVKRKNVPTESDLYKNYADGRKKTEVIWQKIRASGQGDGGKGEDKARKECGEETDSQERQEREGRHLPERKSQEDIEKREMGEEFEEKKREEDIKRREIEMERREREWKERQREEGIKKREMKKELEEKKRLEDIRKREMEKELEEKKMEENINKREMEKELVEKKREEDIKKREMEKELEEKKRKKTLRNEGWRKNWKIRKGKKTSRGERKRWRGERENGGKGKGEKTSRNERWRKNWKRRKGKKLKCWQKAHMRLATVR
ncbi:hypothetical protein OS493_018512 [Desmophyllum pertusum]|uniref:Uncharacterized protein n=1 Tax=Desmophyllum pertusum TaxID=174260 RepID=A0A9X0A1T4_9CNID|nr:hypothetical protein OS493_018512 [Desmophyllum pertusum]